MKQSEFENLEKELIKKYMADLNINGLNVDHVLFRVELSMESEPSLTDATPEETIEVFKNYLEAFLTN
jgi:hypothetical protein